MLTKPVLIFLTLRRWGSSLDHSYNGGSFRGAYVTKLALQKSNKILTFELGFKLAIILTFNTIKSFK